jgi:hypothetical protein
MISNEDKEILLDHENIAAEKKVYELKLAIHEKYLEDWREVLSTPAGRRIVWDLLGGMGFQRDLFNTDPLIMAMNCGQHKLSLAMAKDIEEAVPGVTFRMLNEHRSAQANKEK